MPLPLVGGVQVLDQGMVVGSYDYPGVVELLETVVEPGVPGDLIVFASTAVVGVFTAGTEERRIAVDAVV